MPTRVLLPVTDVDYSHVDWIHSSTPSQPIYPELQSQSQSKHIALGAWDEGYVTCGLQEMVDAVSISSVTVEVGYYASGGGIDSSHSRVYLKSGGTNYNGSTVLTTGGGGLTATFSVHPATSNPWTTATLNAIDGIGFEVLDYVNEIEMFFYYLRATVVYVETPVSVEVSRHLASVDLRLKKNPEAFVTFDGTMDLTSVDMLSKVSMEHIAAPAETAWGWGRRPWQQRPMAVHGISIDQNAYRASLKLKDERPLLCLVHDYAFSNKASGTLLDGIARFSTPGSEFVFTRPGTETFTNPVGDSETAPIDSPGYADGGLQMLAGSGSRYYVTNNSGARTFSAALGGYQCEIKLLGTLAEDRVIAYAYHDASNYMKLWYDNASTKIKFTMRVNGTSTTVTALASPSASTWYQIGIYWTGENGENDLPPYSMALYIERVLQATAQIDGTGSNKELLINGGFESSDSDAFNGGWTDTSTGSGQVTPTDGSHGGTAPRTGTWACRMSRILSSTGIAQLTQDVIVNEGDSIVVSAYCYSNGVKSGSVIVQDLTTGKYYDGSANTWTSSLVVMGSSTAAAYTLITETMTIEGTTGAAVVLRITLQASMSSAGAVTFDDVSVLGPSKIMTEAAVSKFDFGSAAGSDILRGQIRKIVSYQYVPTDTEMKRTL